MGTHTFTRNFADAGRILLLRRCSPGAALFLALGLLAPFPLRAGSPEPEASAAILQELRHFAQVGRVLYVAAHPDDENTQLLAYLARGPGYRTAYLSLTRGDGGQNVLGPQFGEQLGVIRTQELLAARRIDGAQQFFTRAIDFGFSKDYRETLRIWDEQQVLGDVVRVIRIFRPDVIITRFSPEPGGTHGHHTASAVLALRAFKLAGDPKAFPEQLGRLQPWQPKRILHNGWRGPDISPNDRQLKLEIGGTDPVSGESFSEIAGRSRSMHKTQGFGNFRGGGNRAERPEYFQLLDGSAATNDIFEGINTTWSRLPGGDEIARLTEQLIRDFTPAEPSQSVPGLLVLRGKLAGLATDGVIESKRQQLDHILQACLGLSVATTVPSAEVVPGETLRLRHSVLLRTATSLQWVGINYPTIKHEQTGTGTLRPNETAVLETTQILPANTPLSQPYWLRQDHPPGTYRVDDPALIGRPENPPVFPVDFLFALQGQTFVVHDEPVADTRNSTNDGARRRLDVIAPVALSFASEIGLFAPGSRHTVEVDVTSYRPQQSGQMELAAPAEWKVEPLTDKFHLAAVGERARCSFAITAPSRATSADISASARMHSAVFGCQRIELHFPHIPLELLQPPARMRCVSLELALRGREVGYLPGAGDSLAENLAEMGCHVTLLTSADLVAERLHKLDSIVVGVRAFNVRTDLVERLPGLFAYVEAGGNLIVQYNRPNGLKTNELAPFSLRLSDERVTDEDAPVTFLAPEHPVLNSPNRITAEDFKGWVQERGVYFPNRWDEHFTPILSCHDPGESAKNGGLLVARYGRGYFVYTGLAWFRQLPAGVPGAYRLFANLVSLGK